MQANLAVISFVCAGLLALFIPIARVRQNVANLAIISWLLGANVVHGINAIIWAGNVEPHVPVWCDIVTKLMVGATIALPGAFLSVARRLELVSSTRPISKGPKASRFMLEFILCYIIPLFYMCIHFVVQDHRFDLVEDYGCSASIHPSVVGLTLMWLPPILLCCASLFLCGASISHSFDFPSYAFSTHLEQRSPITSSNFIRHLTITIITSVVLFVIFLFSIFTISQFIPYTSWSAVHVEFSTINIIRDADAARSIEIPWLGVPIVSLVYIVLVLVFGEETRDASKWIRDHVGKIPKWHPRSLLLLPLYSAQTRSDMESRIQLSTPPPRPGLELRSGWDDMLETGSKKSWFWSSIRKSPSSPRATSPVPTLVKFPSPPTSRTSTPSPSPSATSPTVCGEDDPFIKSTLEYLGSPTAKTLGIAPSPLMIPTSPVLSPILSPPPAYVSPRKATYHDTSLASPTSVHSNHNMPPSPRHVPADVESVISSVFDASWPQPPPATPKLTQYQDRITKSRSTSPAGSTDTRVHLRPIITASYRYSRPAKRASSVKRLLRTSNSEKV
ncbi:Pheromone B beta 1 receptor [Termitomyces sp. T112]|nr:hypothetical protein C0989_000586 [Termitomyces sp. Mn162]KAG5722669.1 Pheromone B beta 1 receptor [Termitomyces sp. T112]KAH0579541.1 hypothetical protein H2248_002394 [Termitomyces sp. 'cryptogamus']KNZ77953.1 Pheromone B beta 1 receptor [Termitomyces sp. J132]